MFNGESLLVILGCRGRGLVVPGGATHATQEGVLRSGDAVLHGELLVAARRRPF